MAETEARVAEHHLRDHQTLFDPTNTLDARIDTELILRAFARFVTDERTYQALRLLLASGGEGEAVEDLVDIGWRPVAAKKEMTRAMAVARAVAIAYF